MWTFIVLLREDDSSYHWCLSDRPFQSGSVRTIRSMSFFHSIPSEMTLCHSLHTSSAEHRERASRKDKIFSAIWSKPWAEREERKTVCKLSTGGLLLAAVCIFTWQRSDEVPLQHGFEVGVYVAVLVVAHTGNQALNKLHLVGLRPLVKEGDAVFLLLLIVSLWRSLTGAHYRTVSMLQRAAHVSRVRRAGFTLTKKISSTSQILPLNAIRRLE